MSRPAARAILTLVALAHATFYIVYQRPDWATEWTDQNGYALLGRVLADTGRFTRYPNLPRFVPEVIRTPGYPLFVAAIDRVIGQGHLAVATAQALVFAAICLLVYALALRVVNDRIAFAAALFTALYPPLPYFAALTLTEVFTTFLVTLGVYLWLRSLAARGETPAAFGRRCIPAPPHDAQSAPWGPWADCVAPPSNIPDILGRRALSAGRLAALGATPDFHHGLLGAAVDQQPPTFTAANRTVAVYATVTDAGGRLVPDLERTAFEIDDNGKRQELTLFANEIQPITAVMLLDRSGSMRANFDLVESAAEQFVNALLPADQARIGSFANRIQLDPRDFTSDHDELRRILKTELQPEGPTPLWNAVNVGITALLHQQGRRVILVFTDGVDAPMNFSNTNNSLKDVMKRAEEENVMVYAIGLAGNNTPTAGGPHGGWGGPGGGRRMPGGRGGVGGWGGPRGGFGGGRPFVVDNKPDEGLPKIAAATGGGYF